MPTTPRFPKYRHYKPKNLAVVRLDGQDIYLGKYDSPESWEKYHRLAADRIQNGRPVPIADRQEPTSQLTIIGMLHLYRDYARTYYIRPNGQPSKELTGMKAAAKRLRVVFGHTAAAEFGPKDLKTLREHLIKSKALCRREINKRKLSKRLTPRRSRHKPLTLVT